VLQNVTVRNDAEGTENDPDRYIDGIVAFMIPELYG
jgi:hypothetical protein